MFKQIKSNLSLYSVCYAKACNKLARPSPRQVAEQRECRNYSGKLYLCKFAQSKNYMDLRMVRKFALCN